MKNWYHGKTNGLKCIWWNEEFERLIRVRKACLLIWKYRQRAEAFLEYKRVAINTKSRLREIEKKSSATFVRALIDLPNCRTSGKL
jgi:hypothetical protein